MARGYEEFATGQLVPTATINDKFIKQGIPYFADATARDAAITSPLEGMHAYTADTDTLWQYSGSGWVDKFVAKTLVDAKGDLLVGTADNAIARVAVGANGSVLQADSTQAGGVSWLAGGTDRLVYTGFSINEAAVTTNSQLYRIMFTGGTTVQNRQLPVVADRAGSVVGISVAADAARNAGSMTFEVYINGSGTGLTVVLDGTNTQYHYTVQAAGLDTFSAGARLDVRATNASWGPAGAQFEASIIVQNT